MPYWAPESMDEYEDRLSLVLAGTHTPQFETVFLRADGVRVPVLVFESRAGGRGWTPDRLDGSILDITDRKQVEELNRMQQEKLQASARLASMGELASTLAHELNQPLAAISSYTTGALNMLTGRQRSIQRSCSRRWKRPMSRRSAPATSSAASTNSSNSASRSASWCRFRR